MEPFLISFDLAIANSISPEVTQKLLSFFEADTIRVLNIDQYLKTKMHNPCISSHFFVSDGGSYSYEKNYRHVYIHNGTIGFIEGFIEVFDFISEYCSRVFPKTT
jgi:hypothetical protein